MPVSFSISSFVLFGLGISWASDGVEGSRTEDALRTRSVAVIGGLILRIIHGNSPHADKLREVVLVFMQCKQLHISGCVACLLSCKLHKRLRMCAGVQLAPELHSCWVLHKPSTEI